MRTPSISSVRIWERNVSYSSIRSLSLKSFISNTSSRSFSVSFSAFSRIFSASAFAFLMISSGVGFRFLHQFAGLGRGLIPQFINGDEDFLQIGVRFSQTIVLLEKVLALQAELLVLPHGLIQPVGHLEQERVDCETIVAPHFIRKAMASNVVAGVLHLQAPKAKINATSWPDQKYSEPRNFAKRI